MEFFTLVIEKDVSMTNDSQYGRLPKNYGKRVAMMNRDEAERIQKEIYAAKMEAIHRKTAKPRPKIKLDRMTRQFWSFHAYSLPLAAVAVYYVLRLTFWAHSVESVPLWFYISFFLLFLFWFTLLIGSVSFYVYSLIYQPWIFVRIPEDKLPPLDDSNDQEGANGLNASNGLNGSNGSNRSNGSSLR